MATKPSEPKLHTIRHRDGSLWARGVKVGNTMTGRWEWFRKDGSKLRSGCFENGRQTGTWTTYDRNGNVYKVTHMKAT